MAVLFIRTLYLLGASVAAELDEFEPESDSEPESGFHLLHCSLVLFIVGAGIEFGG